MLQAPELADSPSAIVSQLLIDLGLCSTTQVPSSLSPFQVYYSNEPSSPDNVVTVFDTVGVVNSRDLGYGRYWTYWGLQIRVRATTYDLGWQQAQWLRTNLMLEVDQNEITLDNGNQYCILPFTGISQVIPIGVDTPNTKRLVFTLNLMAVISQINPSPQTTPS